MSGFFSRLKIFGVVNNFDDKGAARAGGNLFASLEFLQGDCKSVPARTRIVVSPE